MAASVLLLPCHCVRGRCFRDAGPPARKRLSSYAISPENQIPRPAPTRPPPLVRRDNKINKIATIDNEAR